MKEFNVLYLQKYFSRNPNPLKGRKLYERFRAESDQCRLGYIVRPDKNALGPEYTGDIVSFQELDELRPDIIFLEGGLIDGGQWRVAEECIRNQANRGAIVIISDLDWNTLNGHAGEHHPVESLCGVSIIFDGNEPAELYDPASHYESERTIVCKPGETVCEPWLAPVYAGLQPFVVGLPAPMRAWVELVATCNPDTTQSTQFGYGAPASGAFAAAKRIGQGYVVLILGNVSSDVWMDEFPGNIEWLLRLSRHMLERVRIDRRLNQLSYQVFISHRHSNQRFAAALGDALRSRGFGTWIDSRELLAGDRLTPEVRQAIAASSHVAVLWAGDCSGAQWINLELDAAIESGKRIFVIRLDETPVRAGLADLLRVEAQNLSPEDAAKQVALFIEAEERRKAASPSPVN